jgi:hypothetical protein
MHLLPKAGEKPEWRHSQDYWVEKDQLPEIDLDDAAFVYDNAPEAAADQSKVCDQSKAAIRDRLANVH